MPSKPAVRCDTPHLAGQSCESCDKYKEWIKEYRETVDDLVVRSNVHVCRASRQSRLDKKRQRERASGREDLERLPDDFDTEDSAIAKAARYGQKGCLNKDGVCTARFPRDVRDATQISEEDGHIYMKKLKSMINTFTPALSFVTRCNTDVSSLLSGTSIKAIISYVTDYVTKPALKTYQVFSSTYDVYSKNSELIGERVQEGGEAARTLIMKIVNSLASKMEIGSPMAWLYLLENPDHYTSHTFVPFWWRSYVSHVKRYSESNVSPSERHSPPLTTFPSHKGL
ncbi:hypothetical protein D9613_012865 [Agrocybe pediades]|uniref:Uncharacterized protein n=1 Tax=Agrocybe pediades TaxID=84607 RepID=A0A8H4QWE4_9AGAR|nr:hypothetical protein D9613_012865 [Agrocybe pediades]